MVKVKGIYKLGVELQDDVIKEEERKQSKHKLLPHYQQFVKRGFDNLKDGKKDFQDAKRISVRSYKLQSREDEFTYVSFKGKSLKCFFT
jgi:hypothetical protein